jgi:NCS1 family nucleobase:cation symporter-1
MKHALGAELLFVNQSFYHGPLLSAVGGNDISWILGFFVPLIVYYVLARVTRRSNPNSALSRPVSAAGEAQTFSAGPATTAEAGSAGAL